jgi:hypothetical protein
MKGSNNSSDLQRTAIHRPCRHHAIISVSHPTIVRVRARCPTGGGFCDCGSRPSVSTPTRPDPFRMTTIRCRMFVAQFVPTRFECHSNDWMDGMASEVSTAGPQQDLRRRVAELERELGEEHQREAATGPRARAGHARPGFAPAARCSIWDRRKRSGAPN